MSTRHRNSFKEKIASGKKVFGTFNIIPSPSLVNAIGCSGIDFIVIDAEHGSIDMETAENSVRAAEVTGMTPIVRVPDNEPFLILKALDIGAYGIQVPHISTKKEAELVVEYSKYYPIGGRGFSPFTRSGSFGIAAEGYPVRANENTIVVINIEGTKGIENLSDIIKVPNIDVVFIGPYDLSQSLGKPGKVNDNEVVDLLRKSVETINNAGLVSGSFAKDLEYLEILVDCGVQYITCLVDAALISSTYKNLKETFDSIVSKNKRKNCTSPGIADTPKS